MLYNFLLKVRGLENRVNNKRSSLTDRYDVRKFVVDEYIRMFQKYRNSISRKVTNHRLDHCISRFCCICYEKLPNEINVDRPIMPCGHSTLLHTSCEENMLEQYGVCIVCKKSGNKINPVTLEMEQVTTPSKTSTFQVKHQILQKCTCNKLLQWEESCNLCLSVTRSKTKDKKVRVKPGDFIRFRSSVDKCTDPKEEGTIRSISNLTQDGSVTIGFFETKTVISFMDSFKLLKTYHIPKNEDGQCLLDIPEECLMYRRMDEYVYTLGTVKKEHLHKTHSLHTTLVDFKSFIRNKTNRARRISETLLGEKELPSDIVDYEKYNIDCKEDNKANNPKKLGKRYHGDSVLQNDENSDSSKKLKQSEINLMTETSSSDECDRIQRDLYTSTREKKEKGK